MNLAGGEAYAISQELELVAVLVTAKLEAQYYRKASASLNRIKELVAQISDKEFVAKAAVYARNMGGMRSTTHVVAAELAKSVKGAGWMRFFLNAVAFRPDDVLEILGYYLRNYHKPVPNSLKKGLGSALARFSGYQLAKYRKEDSDVSMVDAVNLLHPKGNPQLKALIDGTLKPAETWETALTQAGQKAETDEELANLKAEAWAEQLESGKIGYFALVRNLRNIQEHAPAAMPTALKLLVDENRVRKSKVWPAHFYQAFKAVANEHGHSETLTALSKAVDLALANVPKLPGKTLIALDCSSSMGPGYASTKTGMVPIEHGAVFAATLIKAMQADLIMFDELAKYVNVDFNIPTMYLADLFMKNASYGGTNFDVIFKALKKNYQRIIILSDMQAWMTGRTPKEALREYRNRFEANPKIYSFDLAGYGTMQFPEPNVCALAGFSEKVFDIMELLETDPKALVNTVKRIAWTRAQDDA